MTKQTNHILYFTPLYVILLLMASACVYYYPLTSDDFNYSFTMTDDELRVLNLSDVFEGTKNCFYGVNGRTFSNFMVFLFVNIVPQIGMFALAVLTIGTTMYFITNRMKYAGVLPYLIPIFWVLCPSVNETIYWKTGFMNYALPGMFNVVWLWMFFSCKYFSKQYLLPVLVFSIFVGALHEGASLPLSASLFFYMLINHRKISKTERNMSIAYMIGTLFILFTPATFHRVGLASDVKEPIKIVSFFASLLECYYPYMDILILIILCWINRKYHRLKDYCMDNTLILLILIFSFLMFLALSIISVMPAQRYFYFFHVIVLYLLVEELSLLKALNNRIFITSAFFVSFVVIGFSLAKVLHRKAIVDSELELLSKAEDGIVPVDETYITSDSTHYSNHIIANYYQKPFLIAYPSDIYSRIYINEDAETSSISEEWLEVSDCVYARKMQNEHDSVVYKWTKVIDVPIIRSKKFVSVPNFSVVKSKSGNYYQIFNNNRKYTKVIEVNRVQ